jgi:two-component system sensor histidine kinase/response regulator
MSISPAVQLPATILVADDDANLRFMLRHLLEGEGYTVAEAEDGLQTWEMIGQIRPDLILLDAVMPEKSGFEVCNEIQALPAGERIPVLMLTGLDDEESVDRAFEVGAVDFVTKPMHWPVLRQRVRRLLTTRQIEQMRDNLIQMIVHDMKNPISTIRGFAEMLLAEDNNNELLNDSLTRIYHSSDRLLEMTMMILDIGRLEEGKLVLRRSTRAVYEILQEVKESYTWMATNYQVQIEVEGCDPGLTSALDWNLITRVLGNLLGNAIKHSPPDSTVQLCCVLAESPEPALHISVIDQGEGISEQDQSRIFEKFSQVSERRRGSRNDTGLGLTFCKLATEAHGGRIEVVSAIDQGATFTLIFPA